VLEPPYYTLGDCLIELRNPNHHPNFTFSATTRSKRQNFSMASWVWGMLFKHEEPPLTLCEHQRNSGMSLHLHDLNEAGELKTPSEKVETCTICMEEKRRMTIYRRRLIAGLALPFMIQSFDTTIIAGAVTTIASDFSKCPPSQTRQLTLTPSQISYPNSTG
jgi:hypothetical protein